MSIRALRRLVLALPVFAFGAPACDSVTGVCTQIGCDSGLWVRLDALPAGAFSVDVYAVTPNASPSYRYECSPGPLACLQEIFFTDFVGDRPYIRVTTTVGTVLYEIPTLSYETFRPNGPRCDPECRTAETTVTIPAP
jgi:hypothetical protein